MNFIRALLLSTIQNSNGAELILLPKKAEKTKFPINIGDKQVTQETIETLASEIFTKTLEEIPQESKINKSIRMANFSGLKKEFKLRYHSIFTRIMIREFGKFSAKKEFGIIGEKIIQLVLEKNGCGCSNCSAVKEYNFKVKEKTNNFNSVTYATELLIRAFNSRGIRLLVRI